LPTAKPSPDLSLSPLPTERKDVFRAFPGPTTDPQPTPTSGPPSPTLAPSPTQPSFLGKTPTPALPTVLLAAHFDRNEDGFTYVDDAFRGTNNPAYASGAWISSGGFSGGALKVDLGGLDHKEARGMSGGWRRNFKLHSAMRVTLSFRYNLLQAPNYEHDEVSQILPTVDGEQFGTGKNSYVAQLYGDGNGGNTQTTDWQLFQVDLGTLADGDHTFTIGGYNNQKTSISEAGQVLIDDVTIMVSSADGG
jgi:hypothetical protein